MTAVTSEPATKADVDAAKAELRAAVDAAITKAVEPLATKKDLEAYPTRAELDAKIALLATKKDLEAYATKKDLEAYATKADLAAAIAPLATRAELEAWGMVLLDRLERMIDVTIARAVGAAMEQLNRSLWSHAEQVNTDVAAANANTAQLRTELEAHRDDTERHRVPRRRKS